MKRNNSPLKELENLYISRYKSRKCSDGIIGFGDCDYYCDKAFVQNCNSFVYVSFQKISAPN